MSDLNKLLLRLIAADVEFVIVGGFGAVLHGSSLVTRDLDVCAILSSANVEKLRAAFRDLRPAHRLTPQRLSFLENPDPGVEVKNLYLQTDLGALDVLGSITGVGDFSRVAANAVDVELFGRRVRVMCVEDLILAKQALGREKDLLAIKELRAILDKTRK